MTEKGLAATVFFSEVAVAKLENGRICLFVFAYLLCSSVDTALVH
jgi:hypothetical protein